MTAIEKYLPTTVMGDGLNMVRIDEAMTYMGFSRVGDVMTDTRSISSGYYGTPSVYDFTDSLSGIAPIQLTIKVYNSGAAFNAPMTVKFKDILIDITGFKAGSTGITNNGLFSGDGGRLQMVYGRHVDSWSVVSIERVRDQSGNETADGIHIFNVGQDIPLRIVTILANRKTYDYAQSGINIPKTGSGSISANEVVIYPQRFFSPGENPPSLGVAGYFTTDMASDIDMLVSCYDGKSHRFRTLSGITNTLVNDWARADAGLMIRWD